MEMDSSQGSNNLSYYNILGVSMDSSDDQIRRAYRKLAMQWHPDKWTKNPSHLGKAKHKFQQIQEAYSVLSDKKKRSIYDVGLYDPQDEVDEGFADFLQEMSSLMENVKKEEKKYSFGEIQDMFWDMARSFNCSDTFGFDDNVGSYEEPLWSQGMFGWDDYSRSSKRARANTCPLPQFHDPGMSRRETKCV
uniref:dnaJ homolog subfamily B member 6-A n=1 Tax=Erigeron canadensis TaxID=72917 RepID=UPI001CB99857|nr:dnaJ homolog subfamily B member 6-A [Erigeron canadensis]